MHAAAATAPGNRFYADSRKSQIHARYGKDENDKKPITDLRITYGNDRTPAKDGFYRINVDLTAGAGGNSYICGIPAIDRIDNLFLHFICTELMNDPQRC